MATLNIMDLAGVKGHLGIVGSGSDTQINNLIPSISTRIEKYLNRDILKSAKTEVHDIGKLNFIYSVSAYPIDTDQTITVKQDTDSAFGSNTEIDTDNYKVHDTIGQIELLVEYTAWPRSLQISYTGGMATDLNDFKSNYPDIYIAALDQMDFDLKKINKQNVSSKSGGGGSISKTGEFGLLKSIIEVLSVYRRDSFGSTAD